MKVAIFGGAFDPPHLGHINLVKSACDSIKPDKLLIIPTGNAPHKKTMTDFETRFKLSQAAFINCNDCEICDIENTPDTSYTVDTLRKLHEIYPNSELHLIVGADASKSINAWKEPDQIRKLCTIVTGKRDDKSSSQIRALLSAKRYTHSINVAIMCGELSKAHRLSLELSEKSYIAGIFHDIMKECSPDKARLMVRTSGLYPDYVELHEPKLWHGIAGGKYLQEEQGITDKDIINAVRFHTVGRAGMSPVEKVVKVADWVSYERDYDGVEEMRALAFESLDAAVLATIKSGIKKTIKKGGKIPAYAINAYNYYIKENVT